MAIGVIDAARTRCGLRVPEDLMVAGFDDIPAAAWAGYNLTTFVQDAAAMANQALDILRRGLATQKHCGNELVIVPARLMERGTTRRQ